ncbi:MAG TPA: hypothetical protein K8W19_16395 [Victivallis vadensis]|nr:hypothetical protein [Victivallis vadensis]
MPKQDHTPAVSLFSFQDIITSITGIMFLVVLLLLLFILEAEPEAAGREPREKLKEAAARVEELRRQLDLNRAADRELLRKIGEYRRNDPRLLQQRHEELQRQVRELSAEAAQNESEAKKLETELAGLRRDQEAAEKRREELRLQLKAAGQRETELRGELEQAENRELRRRRLVPYTVDGDFGMDPVLAECGPDGIRALALADKSVHDFRRPEALTYFESVEAFMSWARTLDASRVYFCVLVKPAAFRYAEVTASQLQAAGFRRGLEVMPSDESTIFGEEAR